MKMLTALLNTTKIATLLVLLVGVVACDKAPVDFSQNDVSASGLGRVTQEFTTAQGKADILFVVDNSGSMSVEQARMGQSFPQFISSISNIDHQIAITTTDIEATDGRFLSFGNNSDILTPSTPNANNLFLQTIQRPETLTCDNAGFDPASCPSPDERGIFAAYRAIEKGDAKFFREDSHLSIVILSDEDERSRGGQIAGFELEFRDTPQNLVDLDKTRLGAQKTFSVHSVVVRPGDTSCLNQQNSQAPLKGFEGNTYVSLSNLTGGTIGSICASDYGQELGNIATNIIDNVNSVVLQCAAKDDAVAVTLSPQPSGISVTYIPTEQRVQFSQTIPPGTFVQLTYDCE